jgi:hypothetical protein
MIMMDTFIVRDIRKENSDRNTGGKRQRWGRKKDEKDKRKKEKKIEKKREKKE